MSVNLIHANDNASNDNNTWAIISSIALHGKVELEDHTVKKITAFLEDAVLINGEKVTAYPCENEEYSLPDYVASFGPSVLGEDSYRTIRTFLEEDKAGETAVELFDAIVENNIQVTFSGRSFSNASMSAQNWPADDVEINRTTTNMARMMSLLGLEAFNDNSCVSANIPLSVFEKAVKNNGQKTGMPERLQQFVDCAKRSGSTYVYWA